MALIIKNGIVVTATDTYTADLRVDDEKTIKIGQELRPAADTRVLGTTGKVVLAGGVDPRTHLESTSQGTTTTDYLTGNIAVYLSGRPVGPVPHDALLLKGATA